MGSPSGMELDLRDWSESGLRLHVEAGIKASLKWMAARAVCIDPGAFYKQQGGSLTHGNLSPQAPLPAVTQASIERVECTQGGGQDTAGRRGWPRRSRDRQRTGGSCRFSSWEKPLTAFGERAEGITGSGCRQARPCPRGILSYRSARLWGLGGGGGVKTVAKTPDSAPSWPEVIQRMVLGPLPLGIRRI